MAKKSVSWYFNDPKVFEVTIEKKIWKIIIVGLYSKLDKTHWLINKIILKALLSYKAVLIFLKYSIQYTMYPVISDLFFTK